MPPARAARPHLQQLLPHVEQHGDAEAQQAVGAAGGVRQQRVPQAQGVGEGELLRQGQGDPPACTRGGVGSVV